MDEGENNSVQGHTNFEQAYTDNRILIKDALFWTLIQSDPTVDGHMYTNDAPLQISITSLHLHNFGINPNNTIAGSSFEKWEPQGPVGNASFTRLECNITRKELVSYPNLIPWIWTNDTWSITYVYRMYWLIEVGRLSSRNLTVTPPSPMTLLRFYQAYMASVNTWQSEPSMRKLSVFMETVQISTPVLAILILLTLLEISVSCHYLYFLRKYNKELERLCVPDSRIDWMVRAARLAAHGGEEGHQPATIGTASDSALRDRDYFAQAAIGGPVEKGLAHSKSARVYASGRSSIASSAQRSDMKSQSKTWSARSKSVSSRSVPRIVVPSGKEEQTSLEGRESIPDEGSGLDLELLPRSAGPSSFRSINFNADRCHARVNSGSASSRDNSPGPDYTMLTPTVSPSHPERRIFRLW